MPELGTIAGVGLMLLGAVVLYCAVPVLYAAYMANNPHRFSAGKIRWAKNQIAQEGPRAVGVNVTLLTVAILLATAGAIVLAIT